MPGEALGEPFGGTMSLQQKKDILTQMATILKALQEYPVAESIGDGEAYPLTTRVALLARP